MIFHQRAARVLRYGLALSLLFGEVSVLGQGTPDRATADAKVTRSIDPKGDARLEPTGSLVLSPTVARYFDPLQGSSSIDLVRRAVASNGELAAARLDIERARPRGRQARFRPNPSLDFEHTTGRLTGAPGEYETSIGLSVPLELGGQRQRRIELARAELEASEAEIADRETLKGYPDNVKLLLDAGAKLDAKDKRGETPLMHAVERNHTEVIELLKAAGAKE